jgi:hypothetical protein
MVSIQSFRAARPSQAAGRYHAKDAFLTEIFRINVSKDLTA